MATYVVAVSGGVDSVVLLHMLHQKAEDTLIVAHFDHGIRIDSADDATFVKRLSREYNLKFETKREVLGSHASEAVARNRRYAFLHTVAKKHNAIVVTAHHTDDIIETIAINLHRGTGWRGLAVLDSGIIRPLTHLQKAELIEYAKKHNLEWREDSTNATDAYLRNRLRQKTQLLETDVKQQLLALRRQQVESKKMIDQAVTSLIGTGPEYSRYFFTHIPAKVAIECLRQLTKAHLTRPQLERLLLAVKTAAPKSSYQAGSGLTFDFTTRNFSLSLLK